MLFSKRQNQTKIVTANIQANKTVTDTYNREPNPEYNDFLNLIKQINHMNASGVAYQIFKTNNGVGACQLYNIPKDFIERKKPALVKWSKDTTIIAIPKNSENKVHVPVYYPELHLMILEMESMVKEVKNPIKAVCLTLNDYDDLRISNYLSFDNSPEVVSPDFAFSILLAREAYKADKKGYDVQRPYSIYWYIRQPAFLAMYHNDRNVCRLVLSCILNRIKQTEFAWGKDDQNGEADKKYKIYIEIIERQLCVLDWCGACRSIDMMMNHLTSIFDDNEKFVPTPQGLADLKYTMENSEELSYEFRLFGLQ